MGGHGGGDPEGIGNQTRLTLTMIRILHTADWHLGKKLDHLSRLEEQRRVLEEICSVAEQESVDVVLIAGDLYDSPNPSIEAIELFYQTLKRLAADGQRAVVGIAGNHDSPDRIEAPDPLARECGILLSGYPDSQARPFKLPAGLAITRSAPGFMELKLPRTPEPLRLLLTPYANEVRLRKYLGAEQREVALRSLLQSHWKDLADTYCDAQGVNILMAHLYVTRKGEVLAEEDEEERSVLTVGGAQEIFTENFPGQLQYVALGHLHGPLVLQESPFPVVYSSSPLCYSINDRNKEKQVFLIEARPGQPVHYRPIPLRSGRPTAQVRCEGVEDALKWLEAHPGLWVELVLVTDEYLRAQDRKRLLDAHDGIVRIIPELKNPDFARFTSGKNIDLTKQTEALFAEYFEFKKGQPPNQELIDLLQEIIHEGEDHSD